MLANMIKPIQRRNERKLEVVAKKTVLPSLGIRTVKLVSTLINDPILSVVIADLINRRDELMTYDFNSGLKDLFQTKMMDEEIIIDRESPIEDTIQLFTKVITELSDDGDLSDYTQVVFKSNKIPPVILTSLPNLLELIVDFYGVDNLLADFNYSDGIDAELTKVGEQNMEADRQAEVKVTDVPVAPSVANVKDYEVIS